MNKYIFSGIHYYNNEACLLLDSGNKPACERIVTTLRDKTVKIIRHKARFCTGYYDIDTLQKHPCPTVSPVKESDFHCHSCSIRMAFNPYFYNVKKDALSRKQQSYLNEEHVVYLAFFGGGYVKVGITNKRRQYTRLFEQGARHACIVAECSSAYEARKIEHNFITLCGVKEVVRKSTKRKLALISYDQNVSKNLFSKMITTYNTLTQHLDNVGMNDFINLDNESFFAGYFPVELINDVSNISPIRISGKVLGTIGENLFVDTGTFIDLIDTSFIKSHIVSFEITG
ncbi:DUF2797 domain-containing protein [Serratia fonticola]|uniref:DUF2797 domain-containing protein n=1 Tax=Serratia fonticola TaxID=47917 RepID=UPI002178B841|nr:DUF2797 domain-containing protein [Serratia fonticola]CAI0878346.1 Protein of uncharacterised function (DUF2797) [Serratia fonticola]CAI0911009.1 Protein of uncharacterised function (DUF2797) [Serratia fonticola]